MSIFFRNNSQTPDPNESEDFLDRIAAAAGLATAAHG